MVTYMEYFLTISSSIIFIENRIQKRRPPVGRIKLCACVFGIGLLNPVKREDDDCE